MTKGTPVTSIELGRSTDDGSAVLFGFPEEGVELTRPRFPSGPYRTHDLTIAVRYAVGPHRGAVDVAFDDATVPAAFFVDLAESFRGWRGARTLASSSTIDDMTLSVDAVFFPEAASN